MKNLGLAIAVLVSIQVLPFKILVAQSGTNPAGNGTGVSTQKPIDSNTIVTDPNGHQLPASANEQGNSAGNDLPSANNNGITTDDGELNVSKKTPAGNWGLLGLLGLLGLIKILGKRQTGNKLS